MELLGAEGAAGSTTASIVKLNCIIDPVLIEAEVRRRHDMHLRNRQ